MKSRELLKLFYLITFQTSAPTRTVFSHIHSWAIKLLSGEEDETHIRKHELLCKYLDKCGWPQQLQNRLCLHTPKHKVIVRIICTQPRETKPPNKSYSIKTSSCLLFPSLLGTTREICTTVRKIQEIGSNLSEDGNTNASGCCYSQRRRHKFSIVLQDNRTPNCLSNNDKRL
jgi:hypothetical protein